MNWTRFALALVTAGAATSLTDWFFFGFLFHGKYRETPETWRSGSEGRKIAWSMVIVVLAAAFFFHWCLHFDVHGYHHTLSVAFLAWFAAALPITVTNALFIKYNSLVVVSHSLGWLARLVIAALAYVWLLG
jgi:hypothetical protein